MQQAEHHQLEAESLVEAARERDAMSARPLDAELMREALEALKPLAQCAEDSPSTSPDHRTLYDGAFVGIVLGDARRARATITKLEQRLLEE